MGLFHYLRVGRPTYSFLNNRVVSLRDEREPTFISNKTFGLGEVQFFSTSRRQLLSVVSHT